MAKVIASEVALAIKFTLDSVFSGLSTLKIVARGEKEDGAAAELATAAPRLL